MLIDLHNHTAASYDSSTTLADYERAYGAGAFGVVAITDHNTLAGALAFRRAASFPVIVGEEIGTADGEVIGLFLREPIARGLSAVETARRIKAQGGLVYIPHPFLHGFGSPIRPEALESILPAVDLFEVFNAVIPFGRANRRAEGFSRERGLVAAAGSDAHFAAEIGRAGIDVVTDRAEAALDPRRLCQMLSTGRLVAHPTPLAARLIRRAIQMPRGRGRSAEPAGLEVASQIDQRRNRESGRGLDTDRQPA